MQQRHNVESIRMVIQERHDKPSCIFMHKESAVGFNCRSVLFELCA